MEMKVTREIKNSSPEDKGLTIKQNYEKNMDQQHYLATPMFSTKTKEEVQGGFALYCDQEKCGSLHIKILSPRTGLVKLRDTEI